MFGIRTSAKPWPRSEKAMFTPSFVFAYWMRGSMVRVCYNTVSIGRKVRAGGNKAPPLRPPCQPFPAVTRQVQGAAGADTQEDGAVQHERAAQVALVVVPHAAVPLDDHAVGQAAGAAADVVDQGGLSEVDHL